jgi:hypothetical protein
MSRAALIIGLAITAVIVLVLIVFGVQSVHLFTRLYQGT